MSVAGDKVTATVRVDVPIDEAFRVFTEEIDLWWRRGRKFRVSGSRTGIVALEPGVGGRLFESFETKSGAPKIVESGRVTDWDPPHRVAFEWRTTNFRDDEKTFVEVRFAPGSRGTNVTVTHSGWAALRADHPVRHGLDVPAYIAARGRWWGELLSSLRLHADDDALVDRYLERIGQPRAAPSIEALTALHRAHLRAVPFENLDIVLGRSVSMAMSANLDKVIGRRRGGFCYELNSAFRWLLDALGYEVDVLSGRVFGDDDFGPPYDHMLLRVKLDPDVIADVGFGDSFVDPLPFDTERGDLLGRRHRVVRGADEWVLEQWATDDGWTPQYTFTTTPRAAEEFVPMCAYHRSSPSSPFTKRSVCSIATREGRVTLSNGRWITTTREGRDEAPVESIEACRERMLEVFGVALPVDDVARIVAVRD